MEAVVSLDPTTFEIRAFRRRTIVTEQAQSIVPELLMFPPPPSTLTKTDGSSNNKETQEEPSVVQPLPKHPLTETTGTILGVNLDLVASDFHLHSAIYRALTYNGQSRGKTKAILTEILYQLASTGNINEAIRQYFVTADTSEFALVRISGDEETRNLYETLASTITNNPSVEEFNLSDINNRLTQDAALREKFKRIFKLSQFECGPSSIHHAIITKLALKDM